MKTVPKNAWVACKVRRCNVRVNPGIKFPVRFTAVKHELIGKAVRQKGDWVKVIKTKADKSGWVHVSLIYVAHKPTHSRNDDAKAVLAVALRNDKLVFGRLSSIYAKILPHQDKIPAHLRNEIDRLRQRYNARQKALEKRKGVKSVKRTLKEVEAFLAKAYRVSMDKIRKIFQRIKSFLGIGDPSVGFAPLLIVAAVVVVMAVGAAIGWYFASYQHQREAAEDYSQAIKLDAEVTKILNSLRPEQRKKLEDEFRRQAEAAYNAGQDSGGTPWHQSLSQMAFWTALGIVGYKLINNE